MHTIGCKQRRATCWQAEGGAEDASGIKNFGPGAAGLAEGQQRRVGALSLALCGLRDVPLGELELRLHECRGFLVDKPWACFKRCSGHLHREFLVFPSSF